MILETPIQSEIVLNEKLSSIRNQYIEFEATFVLLHPFLQFENEELLKSFFNRKSNSNSIQNISNITWTEIVARTGIKSIKDLDQSLAYLHCARQTACKSEWIKLMSFIEKHTTILVPQVDFFPEVHTKPLIKKLLELNQGLLIETDRMTGEEKLVNLAQFEGLIRSFCDNIYSVTTLDNSIKFDTNFDQRFSYISANRVMLESLIKDLNWEGFFCDMNTVDDWSYQGEPIDSINWSSPERKKRYD